MVVADLVEWSLKTSEIRSSFVPAIFYDFLSASESGTCNILSWLKAPAFPGMESASLMGNEKFAAAVARFEPLTRSSYKKTLSQLLS